MTKYILPLFLFSLFVYANEGEQDVFVDGVAAIVGEHIVLKSDVAQLVNMAAVQQQLDPTRDMEKLLRLQADVVRSVVDQKIILEMAAVDSIEVDEKEVDRALDQQIEMFVTRAGGEESAEEMLGQSLKSFRREFWYEMKDRLTTERYQQTLINKINVSRADVESFYSTYRDSLPSLPLMVKMRHILIPVRANESSRQATYDKLAKIRDNILGGENFEELASLYSQDPGSRQGGGSLGYVRRGALVPEFEAVAFSQETGAISDIVETQFGYHIIETEEKLGDKIKVRHILMVPEILEEDDSKAYRFSISIKDSASTIEEFKRLASIHSIDGQTKELGGDLGWVNPASSPIPEIAQIINLLEVGECSLPVRTENGYHLFWVDSFRQGGRPSLDIHWPEIEGMALNHKRITWYNSWVASARENFFIQINTW